MSGMQSATEYLISKETFRPHPTYDRGPFLYRKQFFFRLFHPHRIAPPFTLNIRKRGKNIFFISFICIFWIRIRGGTGRRGMKLIDSRIFRSEVWVGVWSWTRIRASPFLSGLFHPSCPTPSSSTWPFSFWRWSYTDQCFRVVLL